MQKQWQNNGQGGQMKTKEQLLEEIKELESNIKTGKAIRSVRLSSRHAYSSI